MASGIDVAHESLDRYRKLRGRHEFDGVVPKWIIFTMNGDNTEIVVEKFSGDSDYEAFLEELPENESRYAVYDFEYDLEDAGKRNKILFILWSPDSAGRKQKMVYAASRAGFRAALDGIGADIQANDLDDISLEAVTQKVTRR